MRFGAPVDVTGTYVAAWNSIDTGAACALGAEMKPGVMRVSDQSVAFSDQTCRISDREVTVDETTEGRSTTVTLQLVCDDDPVGPEGQNATLWLNGLAQITTYVPAGSGYVEAHGMYRACAHLPPLTGGS